jgi:hypothetical protein
VDLLNKRAKRWDLIPYNPGFKLAICCSGPKEPVHCGTEPDLYKIGCLWLRGEESAG